MLGMGILKSIQHCGTVEVWPMVVFRSTLEPDQGEDAAEAG